MDEEEGMELIPEEEVQIKTRIQEVMESAKHAKGSNGWRIPVLRRVLRKRLTEMSVVVHVHVSKVIGLVSTHT